jgi:predicted MFS family arabinose efflux permease
MASVYTILTCHDPGIQYERLQKEHEHRRRLERLQVQFKIGFSIGAVVGGVGLTALGFSYIGPFLLGAGVFAAVPDYVKIFYRRREENENE